jgi:hypothetical protein
LKSVLASFKDEENHKEFEDSRLVGQTSKPRFVESENHLPLVLTLQLDDLEMCSAEAAMGSNNQNMLLVVM